MGYIHEKWLGTSPDKTGIYNYDLNTYEWACRQNCTNSLFVWQFISACTISCALEPLDIKLHTYSLISFVAEMYTCDSKENGFLTLPYSEAYCALKFIG